MISITSAPEAPPPRIRIVDSRGREVETVRIGDKLTFRIEIPEDSKYSLVLQALLWSLEMSLLLYWNPWQVILYFLEHKTHFFPGKNYIRFSCIFWSEGEEYIFVTKFTF